MDSDEDYDGLKVKEGGTLIDKSPKTKRAAETDKADAALLSDDDSLPDDADTLVLGYSDTFQPSGNLLPKSQYEDGESVSGSDQDIDGYSDSRQLYADREAVDEELVRETTLVDEPNDHEYVPAQPIATDVEISKIATVLKDTVHVSGNGRHPTPGRPIRVSSRKHKGRRKGKNEKHTQSLIELDGGKHRLSDSELDHTDGHYGSSLGDGHELEWDDQFGMPKSRKSYGGDSDSDSDSSEEESDLAEPSPSGYGAVLPGQGLDVEELFVAPIRGKPLIQLDYDTDCNESSNKQTKSSRVKTRYKVYLDDPDIHQLIMELSKILYHHQENVKSGAYRKQQQEVRRQQQGQHMSLPDVSFAGRRDDKDSYGLRNARSLNTVGPYNGHGKPGRTIMSRIMQESESSSDDDKETSMLGQRRAGAPYGRRGRLGPDMYEKCPDCGERHPPDSRQYPEEDLEICPDCGVAHNPYQHPPSPTSKDRDEDEQQDTTPSVVGPHRREELLVGAMYKMKYLGSSQVITHHPVTKETRMQQAQEAYSRIKVPDGELQPATNVDVVISTERIKVINADDKLRDLMMDHALRTVCFICDMGNILVLMARRLTSDQSTDINLERNFSASLTSIVAEREKKTSKSMCHVFECEQAQMVAKAIGQAFNIAYEEFLRHNGIRHDSVEEAEYSHVLESQKIVGKDLPLLADTSNAKDVVVQKKRGESLGIMLIESGWGSMLPTVFVAHLANYAPAARLPGQLAVGDHILACNGASLVGLPVTECNQILKNTRSSTRVILNIVSCPPVVEVLINRPDTKYQLGFSVKNGTICSLLRGGIAERGGVRVGHRIIEVNGESMVAQAHQHIVDVLANTTGEILMKTMPVAMYRLMVGLDAPQHV